LSVLRARRAIEEASVIRHFEKSRRLRLEFPGLLGNADEAERIERTLQRRAGVVRAVANPNSGRVLVEYAPGARFQRDLVEVPSPAPARPQEGEVRREAAEARTSRPAELAFAWHSFPVDRVFSDLDTSAGGLTAAEAQRRLQMYGPNLVHAPRNRTRLEILIDQVRNLPTALLLGSAGISSIFRDFFDAGAIMAVVGLNSAIGYQIEKKNEDLVASWRRLEAGEARVVRDGSLSRLKLSRAEGTPL